MRLQAKRATILGKWPRLWFWAAIGALLSTNLILGAGVAEAGLTIVFEGLSSDQGAIMTALFDNPKDFKGKTGALRRDSLVVADGRCRWELTGLPPGRYAVAVYHDLNGNQTLDENFFGAPKEPYGFSNNARGTFGPPGFDEAVFTYQGGEQIISIRLE